MSLGWSAWQRDCLQEMGFDVLTLREAVPAAPAPAMPTQAASVPGLSQAQARGARADRAMAALQRIAGGVDLAPLLAEGVPADPAARRALWRRLRPLRKAARAP